MTAPRFTSTLRGLAVVALFGSFGFGQQALAQGGGAAPTSTGTTAGSPATAAPLGATTTPAKGGRQLPAIQLKTMSGAPVDMSTITGGKPTVLSFWATWCSPCKKELTNINEVYEEWQEKYGVQIIAVNIDDARNTSKVKAYVEGVRWPYMIVMDPNGELQRVLNFQTVPYTMLLDAQGNVVYTHNAYVEGDEFVLEEHVAEVAKAAAGKK